MTSLVYGNVLVEVFIDAVTVSIHALPAVRNTVTSHIRNVLTQLISSVVKMLYTIASLDINFSPQPLAVCVLIGLIVRIRPVNTVSIIITYLPVRNTLDCTRCDPCVTAVKTECNSVNAVTGLVYLVYVDLTCQGLVMCS